MNRRTPNGDEDPNTDADPHAEQPIRTAGVLVHGRGARADGMLQFAREFGREGLHYVAPQAQRGTWYPNRFLAPIERNQPHLDSALAHLRRAVEEAQSGGLPTERDVLVGFSQGACLLS